MGVARFEVSKLEFNSIAHIPAWVARSDNNVAAVHFWPGVVFLIFHLPFTISHFHRGEINILFWFWFPASQAKRPQFNFNFPSKQKLT